MKFLNNENIELPKLTFSLLQQLEYIKENKLNLNRLELLDLKYKFVLDYLGNNLVDKLLDGKTLDDINVKNLELLYFSIENEIDKPLQEATVKAQTEHLNSLLSNKNVKQILELYASDTELNKRK